MSTLQSILIVDDQLDNLKLLSDLLKENYRVQAATSGERTLQMLNQGHVPDLFLLDVMMPEMNGYELCQRIKARPETAQTPIIFLTAKNDVESEMRGFEVGAVDYVTKPVHPPALLARVCAHLALATQRQQLQDERDLGWRILEQTQRTANAMGVVNRNHETQRYQYMLMIQELPQVFDDLLATFDGELKTPEQRQAMAKLDDIKRKIIELTG